MNVAIQITGAHRVRLTVALAATVQVSLPDGRQVTQRCSIAIRSLSLKKLWICFVLRFQHEPCIGNVAQENADKGRQDIDIIEGPSKERNELKVFIDHNQH
jgi:hypothetical protein